MAKEIATKTKLDTRIAADIAAAMPVAAQAAVVKTPVAPQDLAKKAIVIDAEEVQAAVEQAVEGSADVIVAQATSASTPAGGAAAGGMSTTALVVAGVAVAAAASSDSSSTTPTSATPTTAPTTAPTAAPTIAPQSLVLTTAQDVVTAGSGNDTITGSDTTVNAGDIISGGAGTDTLKVVSAAAAVASVSLDSVETVMVRGVANTAIDAIAWAGTTTVGVNDTGVLLGTDRQVTFNNLRNNVALELTNFGGLTTNVVTNGVTLTHSASAVGANGTLKISANGVGGANADGSATINTAIELAHAGGEFKTLDLNSVGTARLHITETGAGLARWDTIKVSGAGATTLDFAANADFSQLSTLDLSGATGAVAVSTAAADNIGAGSTVSQISIKGSAGADTFAGAAATQGIDVAGVLAVDTGDGNDTVTLINADTIANLANDSINLGAGTGDAIRFTAATFAALDDNSVATNAALAKITGYERVRISDGLAAAAYDTEPFNVSYIALDAAWTTAANLTNVKNNSTIEVRATAAANTVLNIDVVTPGGTDDVLNLLLNLNLTADAATGSFDITGIDTVNVTAQDRANADNATDRTIGYTLDFDATAGSLSTLNITGTSEVTYVADAADTSLANVNASTLSGDLVMNLRGVTAGQGAKVTGGSGTNTLTGSSGADELIGGARNDTIEGGIGADTMTGGAGTDTFVIRANSTGTPSSTNFDAITDYSKGTDIISFQDADGTNTVLTAAAVTIAGSLTTASAGVAAISGTTGKATFDSADTTLTQKLVAVAAGINGGAAVAAAGEVVFFEHGSDSYVFLSDATAALSATDVVIKLTGVTGLTTINDLGTTITLA